MSFGADGFGFSPVGIGGVPACCRIVEDRQERFSMEEGRNLEFG